jgi:hypothetical protein
MRVGCAQDECSKRARIERELEQLQAELKYKSKAIESLTAMSQSDVTDMTSDTSALQHQIKRLLFENEEWKLKVRSDFGRRLSACDPRPRVHVAESRRV